MVVLTLSLVARAAPAEQASFEIVGEGRASTDLVVHVRHDGELYLGDLLLDAADLATRLEAAVASDPNLRVVVEADARAPYQALVRALGLASEAGAQRVALEVAGLTTGLPAEADPLFPGDAEVVSLDEELSAREERKLAPKHHRFPQNPYGNTASYSAYTLEWGETKLGVGSITTGVLPNVQLGTVPLLDAVGAFNVNGKVNLGRTGPVDFAFLTQYYFVPLTRLLGDAVAGSEGTTVTSSASWLAFGATSSIRLASPWTLHGQLYWARPGIRGEIMTDDLPTLILPGGVTFGDMAMATGSVRGDVAVANLATDVRFNRRDSVFLWVRYPFYAAARARAEASLGALPVGETDLYTNIGAEAWLPITQSYSVAVGYQASMKHVEARIGIGWSQAGPRVSAEGGIEPSNFAWLLQAFELSYKFGGPTRREERRIRKGYRDVKELEEQRETP